MKLISVILIVTAFFSCSTDQGRRVVGDQLSVYYDLPQDEKLAEGVAIYWRENDFLTDNKQDLRIIHVEDEFQLLLIENSKQGIGEIPFEQRKLLNDLKNDLQEQLFHSNLEIVVCNEKFEPKYIIN